MLEEIYDETGVFQAFEAISRVPRGSGHNTEISRFLMKFAKENGIWVRQDQAENIIMVKQASEGMEDLPTVMLQGHMDMVCEKEAGCEHDFLTEGLELYTEEDWIHAKGTTLGADDGIAIAYIMALFMDNTLRHPRLEAVITTDEETGMHGAYALDTSDLTAKYLLNLDSEEEGVFLTSCAGGLTCIGTVPIKRKMEQGYVLKVRIHGLKGGHSGEDINKNRTNAVILLGRMLHDLEKEWNCGCGKNGEGSVRLIAACGGNKDNVIPCEAEAEVLLLDKAGEREEEFSGSALSAGGEKVENKSFPSCLCQNQAQTISGLWHDIKNVIMELCSGLIKKYQKELSASEPGLQIDVELFPESTGIALDGESTAEILKLLYLAPTGVMAMSAEMSGLVESSQNLGIFRVEEDQAIVHFSIRSSVTSAKYYLAEKCKTLINLCGGTYQTCSEYPAWEYRPDSKLRSYVSETYERIYGKAPVLRAIHAGLECGLISEKMPELDILSMGPDIVDIHTPKERMSISSARRVYEFVKELLENWPGGE